MTQSACINQVCTPNGSLCIKCWAALIKRKRAIDESPAKRQKKSGHGDATRIALECVDTNVQRDCIQRTCDITLEHSGDTPANMIPTALDAPITVHECLKC